MTADIYSEEIRIMTASFLENQSRAIEPIFTTYCYNKTYTVERTVPSLLELLIQAYPHHHTQVILPLPTTIFSAI